MAKKPTGFEGIPPHILKTWRAATSATKRAPRDPGPEWLSVRQLCAVWGLKRNQARRRVLALQRKNLIEKGVRDQLAVDGRLLPVSVYRMKDTP